MVITLDCHYPRHRRRCNLIGLRVGANRQGRHESRLRRPPDAPPIARPCCLVEPGGGRFCRRSESDDLSNPMAKTVHTMLRVLDESRSTDFYRRALGLGVADRFAFDDFTLVYLRGRESDFELELTVNHGRTAQYALGDGYGHLAVVVDDLDAEHARLSKEGLQPKPIKEFIREGALMARFFFVEDPDGYKIEVMQKHGRYR